MSNVNDDHEEISELVSTAHHWRDRLQDPDLPEGDRKAFQAWVDADIRHEEAYDRAVPSGRLSIDSSQATLHPILCARPHGNGGGACKNMHGRFMGCANSGSQQPPHCSS